MRSLYESLLDDELEGTVDKIADEHRIEKLLSSSETFIKGYQELIANFGGSKKSIPISQMSSGEYYIVFKQDTLYDEHRWGIYIIIPTGLFRSMLIKIVFHKTIYLSLYDFRQHCTLFHCHR